jgi:hypothetical protein
MRKVALIVATLVLVAAASAAAASDRFVPADPKFVVARVESPQRDPELAALLAAARAAPESVQAATALAAAFVERARARREPAFFGRTEAALAHFVQAGNAPAQARVLYAEALQFRHAFAPAEAVLDSVLRESPRAAAARGLRASIRLVRGEFAAARSDCAMLAQGADAAIGTACLAEAIAGLGELARARALLDAFMARLPPLDARQQAYLFSVRGELRDRAGDAAGASVDYLRALALAPGDDATRASLAELLAARGDVAAALRVLDIDRPSLALMVRRAALEEGPLRAQLQSRANAWLALEVARGDATHWRESALLSLSQPGGAAGALTAARRNFESQRELADVRVLARAAVAAKDTGTVAWLRDWLRDHAYEDAVTENVLAELAAR